MVFYEYLSYTPFSIQVILSLSLSLCVPNDRLERAGESRQYRRAGPRGPKKKWMGCSIVVRQSSASN